VGKSLSSSPSLLFNKCFSRFARDGEADAVEFFLEKKLSDPNAKNKEGWSPLWLAAANGHVAVVTQLLNTGKVNPDTKDHIGSTPLMQAAFNGHTTVVKQLLDIGKADLILRMVMDQRR
jgi:ankyrin repeat protein